MVVVFDTRPLSVPFDEARATLETHLADIGMKANVMHEDVLSQSAPRLAMSFFEADELRATLRMIDSEHLDIRTVTMGISLRDCASEHLSRTCERVYEKIMRSAQHLVATARDVQADYGVPITNKRISVTPIALVGEPSRADSYVPLAETLESLRRGARHRLRRRLLGRGRKGLHARRPGAHRLDPRGAVRHEARVLVDSTWRRPRPASTWTRFARMGGIIKDLARRTAAQDGIGCAKLVVFANQPDDNPFVAGAMHGVGEGDSRHQRRRVGPGRGPVGRASPASRTARGAAARSISATSPRS